MFTKKSRLLNLSKKHPFLKKNKYKLVDKSEINYIFKRTN